MIYISILNLNKKLLTIACINSILKSSFKNFEIYLLDNGSSPSGIDKIKKHFIKNIQVKYYRSDKNLGFAGGNNFLLEKIIPKASSSDIVLFLNNDTEIPDNLLQIISKEAANQQNNEEMIAVRMMQLDNKKEIDNLGLTVYKTGLGINRKDTKKDILFGPSGGCAAFTVNCLKLIHQKTGEYFDSNYFCYAEDVDLAWRGLLLGFKSKYIDDAICYHKGGATSGGNFNKFVMYHTLRNQLFNLVKNMPTGLFFKFSLQITEFQIALFIRYLFSSKIGTLLRVYKDFFKYLPSIVKKRKIIQKTRQISTKELQKYFTKRFY